MTLVMVWEDRTDKAIWIVSDSRIAHEANDGYVLLTDRGAKLLSLTAILKKQTQQHISGIPIEITTLAFAYAGSSLIGYQSYTAVAALWSQLGDMGGGQLPCVEQFTNHLAKFVQGYTAEVSAASGRLVPFECVLVGYDNRLLRTEAWHLRSDIVSNNVAVQQTRLEFGPHEPIHIFGSGADSAKTAFTYKKAEISEPGLGREPLQWIRSLLRTESTRTVGGGVQLGYVSDAGFNLLFDVQPEIVENSLARARFRGFDLDSINRVGDTFLLMSGMA